MANPDLMQAIAERASANPAYTQPIRVPRPQSPPMSQFHRICCWLSVFVFGMTAGVLLYRSLEFFFPYAPPAFTPSPRGQQ